MGAMSSSLLYKLFSVRQNQRLMGIFFVGPNSINELGENDLGRLVIGIFSGAKSAVRFSHFL